MAKRKKIYTPLGANNHIKEDRVELDYYATEPKAIDLLCQVEQFENKIFEPAAGGGHMAKQLILNGYHVVTSDIVQRDYPLSRVCDFLSLESKPKSCKTIITNPPYQFGLEFVKKGLELLEEGQKMAFFLKVLFLEGRKRQELFLKSPPRTVYVFSGRVGCSRRGIFASDEPKAIAYSWFIWEKGFKGDTVIKWIN